MNSLVNARLANAKFMLEKFTLMCSILKVRASTQSAHEKKYKIKRRLRRRIWKARPVAAPTAKSETNPLRTIGRISKERLSRYIEITAYVLITARGTAK